MSQRKRVKGRTKTLFTEDNYKNYLKFCESTGLPYTVIESNYTLSIDSDFLNIDFMNTQMDNNVFIVGAYIKKDILSTGLEPPDFNQDELQYFDFAAHERLKRTTGRIYNIDIKSAYANVLRNHSLISKHTYWRMSRLSKPNRLAVVGMLAAKKRFFEMVGNDSLNNWVEQKETKDWFFFCVNRVNEIMSECKKILGDDFLCYWVDGIFFDSEEKAKKVMRYLHSIGYKYSYDICENFRMIDTDKESKVIYWKLHDDYCQKKVLTLPKKNDKVCEFLINFLSLHKNT